MDSIEDTKEDSVNNASKDDTEGSDVTLLPSGNTQEEKSINKGITIGYFSVLIL